MVILKYLVILAIFAYVFLALGAFYLKNELDIANEQLTHTRANNEVLINTVKKEHQNALDASREKQELEKEIQSDKSGFNWNADISNNNVVRSLKRMHKDKGKLRSN